MNIKVLSNSELDLIIDNKKPLGLFIAKEGDKYIGIDNNRGEVFTEEFDEFEKCIDWLNGDDL